MALKNMDCKTFEHELIDLVLTPDSTPSVSAVAHMKACPPCAEEYVSFQNTFSLLDTWQAPEPTPYFDQKLAVLLREEQAAPRMGWFESLMTRLRFNTGRNFRPAMVGALSLALMVGGGSVLVVVPFPGGHPVQASATVNDLQILDRNEQAFQQLDELQQDDDSGSQTNQDQAPAAPPTT
jgi:hypothetical protein